MAHIALSLSFYIGDKHKCMHECTSIFLTSGIQLLCVCVLCLIVQPLQTNRKRTIINVEIKHTSTRTLGFDSTPRVLLLAVSSLKCARRPLLSSAFSSVLHLFLSSFSPTRPLLPSIQNITLTLFSCCFYLTLLLFFMPSFLLTYRFHL